MQHRTSKRVPLVRQVRVACPTWPQFVRTYTKDISRGGMFIRSDSPPPPGASVEIFLGLPDGSEVQLLATVVHVVSPEEASKGGEVAGMGVRFEQLGEEEERTLRALWEIAALKDAGPAPDPSLSPRRAGPQAVLEHLRQIHAMLAAKDAREVLGVAPDAALDQARAALDELLREYAPRRFARFDDPEIQRAAAAIVQVLQRSLKQLEQAVGSPASERPSAPTADRLAAVPAPEPAKRPSGLHGAALFDDVEVASDQPGATALSAEVQRTVAPGSRTLTSDWRIVNLTPPEEQQEQEQEPGSAAAYLTRCREHLEQEALEAAVRDLQKALALEPGNRKAQAYLHLIDGRRLKRKGELKQAMAKYQAALKLDETLAEAARELRRGGR